MRLSFILFLCYVRVIFFFFFFLLYVQYYMTYIYINIDAMRVFGK